MKHETAPWKNLKRKPRSIWALCITLLALPAALSLGASESLIDLDSWTWRQPSPTGLNLRGIAFGNEVFVAVGDRGTILTSEDGENWEDQSVGIDDLHGIAYGDGQFVAVGRWVALVSTDGVIWERNELDEYPLLYAVAFADGLWVAAGNSGLTLSSPNGLTWTKHEQVQPATYRTVAHGDGQWIALGNGGAVSNNGQTWTKIESPPEEGIYSVIYHDGRFLAAGVGNNQKVYSSENGEEWTAHGSGTTYSFNGLAFAHDRIVAVGSYGRIQISSNFSNWQVVEPGTFAPSGPDLNAIATGGGVTVAVGASGTIRTTTDGTTWISKNEYHVFNDIAFGGGRFLAVGGSRAVSEDGETWSFQEDGPTLTAAIWAEDRFLLAGANRLYSSFDGEEIVQIHQAAADLYSLARGTNSSIAVGRDGQLLHSANLQNWTPVSSGVDEHLFGAEFGAGRFVAVGSEGTIIFSDENGDWQSAESGVEADLFDIAFGDGRFVAVGVRTMLWSSDGETWFPESPAPDQSTLNRVVSITYGNQMFVATSWPGRLLIRPHGGQWMGNLLRLPQGVTMDPGTGRSWGTSAAFGNGTFVLAGRSVLKQSIEMPADVHLTVTNASYDGATLHTGGSLEFEAGLLNSGAADSPETFNVAVYLSRSGKFDDPRNILLKTMDQPLLETGSVRGLAGTVILDATTPAGVYHVLLIPVEGGNQVGVGWRSPTANVLVERTDPERPDLAIESVDAPTDWRAGELRVVTIDIANLSETGTPSDTPFKIEVFLGRKPGFGDSGDVLVGQALIHGLAAGESKASMIKTSLRAEFLQGDYHLKVAVNREGSVNENDFANNVFISPTASTSVSRSITRRQLATGLNHSAAIRDDGTLWTWGNNDHSQLGIEANAQHPSPVRVGEDIDWVAVSAGVRHTLALKRDGSLWAWGDNEFGQLGIAGPESATSPKRVGIFSDWVAVSAAVSHSLGLRADGSLWAWGFNGDGAIGDGTNQDRLSPVKVGDDTDWIAIEANRGAGYNVARSTAIKADGTAWYWGGVGAPQGRLPPAPLPPEPTRLSVLSDGKSLSAYGLLTITRTNGESREIRIGSPHSSFVKLEGDGWRQTTRGSNHTLGLKLDGTLWTTGSNAAGQLGDGSTESRSAAVRIGDESSFWVAASGGNAFSLAKDNNGDFWSWGENNEGQLGQNDLNGRLTPTLIKFPDPVAPFTYDAWRIEHFSDDGDDAGDPSFSPAGVPNLVAYALGLDPWNPDRSRLPVGELTNENEAETYLTITYNRARNRDGVSDLVEMSDNMKDWFPLSGDQLKVTEQTAETETIVGWAIIEPGNTATFLRVRFLLNKLDL